MCNYPLKESHEGYELMNYVDDFLVLKDILNYTEP